MLILRHLVKPCVLGRGDDILKCVSAYRGSSPSWILIHRVIFPSEQTSLTLKVFTYSPEDIAAAFNSLSLQQTLNWGLPLASLHQLWEIRFQPETWYCFGENLGQVLPWQITWPSKLFWKVFCHAEGHSVQELEMLSLYHSTSYFSFFWNLIAWIHLPTQEKRRGKMIRNQGNPPPPAIN